MLFRKESVSLKVLVLGSTGRIGSEVSRLLIERGGEVTVLCRSASSAEELGLSFVMSKADKHGYMQYHPPHTATTMPYLDSACESSSDV